MHPVHKIWYKIGIQQYQDQRRRWMEGSIPNAPRPLQTPCNVLWPYKLSSHIPSNDERNLQNGSSPRMVISIHGWYCHPHKPLHGETEQQHEQRHKWLIHQILEKLKQHDLYLKPEKCEFLKQEIEYLGVIVVLKMNPKKLGSVKNWVIPNNPTEIWKFLEFTGYYRYFIPSYSQITWPLLHLTNKMTPWEWTNMQQLAFNLLKALMCEAPVLI